MQSKQTCNLNRFCFSPPIEICWQAGSPPKDSRRGTAPRSLPGPSSPNSTSKSFSKIPLLHARTATSYAPRGRRFLDFLSTCGLSRHTTPCQKEHKREEGVHRLPVRHGDGQGARTSRRPHVHGEWFFEAKRKKMYIKWSTIVSSLVRHCILKRSLLLVMIETVMLISTWSESISSRDWRLWWRLS